MIFKIEKIVMKGNSLYNGGKKHLMIYNNRSGDLV
jgi:hypothetical protein